MAELTEEKAAGGFGIHRNKNKTNLGCFRKSQNERGSISWGSGWVGKDDHSGKARQGCVCVCVGDVPLS